MTRMKGLLSVIGVVVLAQTAYALSDTEGTTRPLSLPMNTTSSSSVLSTDVSTSSSTTNSSDLTAQEQTRAAAFGLTVQEYLQYKTLMQGTRGVWTPNLDPVLALGLTAQTPQERTYYARLYAQQQHDRVTQELAFEQAYSQAFANLYPNETPVGALPHEDPLQTYLSDPKAAGTLLLFMPLNCASCVRTLQTVLQAMSRNSALKLAVYVLDPKASDAQLRAWANTQNLPRQAVQAGTVSINHDAGLLASHFPTLVDAQPPMLVLQNMDRTFTILKGGVA